MRNRSLIYVQISGNPTFYAVKGSGLRKGVTLNPTVVNKSSRRLQELLLSLKDAIVGVHDIRLTFNDPAFYDVLQLLPHPHSADKFVGVFSFDKKRSARVVAHRSGTVSIMVGASLHPFPRNNLNELLLLLENVHSKLQFKYTPEPIQLPLCGDWIVVQWDYNKDGGQIAGEDFNVSFTDFNRVFYQVYSKDFEDGRRIRLERKESPEKSIREIARDVLDFQG